jgi:hypothetical protein
MSDLIKIVAHCVAEGMAGYRSACSYCRSTDGFKLLSDKGVDQMGMKNQI